MIVGGTTASIKSLKKELRLSVRTNLMLLEVYVVVNFRTRRINRGVYKLAWKPTLIKKKKRK
jgi:hypothetical protein